MSARSFRSVFMVASCAGAALACYLVSLRVASERAALEEVETRIVHAQRDIRLLQTEIGTRGRLAQLERWNVKVLALSAPSADQFLEGGFQLARLVRPQPKLSVDTPVVLASAPAPQPKSAPLEEGEQAADGAGATASATQLLHQASLKLPPRESIAPEPAATPAPRNRAPLGKGPASTAAPAKPGDFAKAQASKLSSTPKKAGDNKAQAAEKAVTKPARTAKVDPLAPLSAGSSSTKTVKDSGTAR
jgi:hypothetical protein